MSTTIRKLVTIICESNLESRLTSDVMRLGAHGYTITDARGYGSRGVRNASWSAMQNIRMEIVCDEKEAQKIAEYMKENYYSNFAMILFSADVEVLRPEKF